MTWLRSGVNITAQPQCATTVRNYTAAALQTTPHQRSCHQRARRWWTDAARLRKKTLRKRNAICRQLLWRFSLHTCPMRNNWSSVVTSHLQLHS
ncbi:hypothetical protein TGPRC2_203735 [Toxoplasma gondii TgCatPRC2]|uniref:Uncharacterized protein n=8 Tax=Toxoplasma gondii TaxID=5811 RepID=A0A125YXC8_TOXGV|nr:hypothetical protein TGGT1_203735 [Toxoplasma gondii GT1]ESS33120.1 hypothetical protein TGVEG_203735 [Toxoplasma gondii VEG]KFG37904.1 hypothetical protein TGDOM2_203735 [Toxoplasma gondii GAB2-2007-GAL-DOM2]KFG39384.1 hypothetical protein TGFOU_203735 [Toxoplasma gondii FOU]KFG46230.1 hypothetical protein TGP89_203735 [Toxoplasma gondii p89]KFG61829.1 hypothetical protein TGRUB_203735 [Toxoplasma gondii RUB]KFH07231.1 hypothetical protein TGVAND_203735 [Toxoplasma gondii VAND]KYK66449.1